MICCRCKIEYSQLTMQAKHFRWIFLAIVPVIFYLADLSNPVIIGSTLEWSDGRYWYAGGSSPSALLLSLVVMLSFGALMASKADEVGRPVASVVRRFAAFWVDFLISMSAIAPIAGTIPAFMEWRRTGIFQWNFARDYPASGDGIVVLSALVAVIIAMAFYFAIPLMTQRPTPGTCVLGYRVIADNNRPLRFAIALKRSALGFIAVARIFRGLRGERDPKEGKFWLDFRFKTRAVEL